MTGRRARSVAVGTWVVTVLGLVAILVLETARSAAADPLSSILWIVLAAVLVSLGARIAVRVPSNPIGWLFLGSAAFAVVMGVWSSALEVGGPNVVADWLGSWTWAPPLLIPITFVLLLFPDGRPPSHRWRPVAWCAGVGIVAMTLELATGQFLGGTDSYGPNPYHVEGLHGIPGYVGVLVLPGILGSALSVVVRFRRSRGDERQQMKWLAWSAVAMLVIVVTASIAGALVSEDLAIAAILVGVLLIPVAIGLAVLRYRLYDIDRLVSRTVTYGLTVACLVAVYVGLVIGVPLLLPVTIDSPALVAAATLLVVALFRPLVQRVQQGVDRRFNRRRYDTQRTLEAFAGRLREQLDLDAMRQELCSVVGTTMQPKAVSLWLLQRDGTR